LKKVAQLEASKLQVAEKLRAMDVDQLVHGLYLEHDLAHHEQVEPVALFNRDAGIMERQQKLPLEVQPGLTEFVGQAGLVGALEQARPERLVHLDG
jgi:hypothetical protein